MASRSTICFIVNETEDGVLRLHGSHRYIHNGTMFRRTKRKAGMMFPVEDVKGYPDLRFDEKLFIHQNKIERQGIIEFQPGEWTYEGKKD